jgi:hypothetical protein
MLAAALTLWAMFSAWLLASSLRLSPAVAVTAAGLGLAELVALLVWSYGTESCDGAGCAPLAHELGVAARTDIPVLAGLFIVLAALQLRRSAASTGRATERLGERSGERMGADGGQEEIGGPERRIHDGRRRDAL